jgi:hypothetical protein
MRRQFSVDVGLAEIQGYLSLLPFDLKPRFKVSARLRQLRPTADEIGKD